MWTRVDPPRTSGPSPSGYPEIGDVHRQTKSTTPVAETPKGLLVLPPRRLTIPLLPPRRVGRDVTGVPRTPTLGVDGGPTADILDAPNDLNKRDGQRGDERERKVESPPTPLETFEVPSVETPVPSLLTGDGHPYSRL